MASTFTQSDVMIFICVYIPPLPANLPVLRHKIAGGVARITLNTLNKVWEELDVCRMTDGAYIDHLQASRLYSPKNWEYWTIYQLSTCHDRDRSVGLGLPPYTIITDSVKSCQVIYSQFGLAIHQNDHQARRRFVEWAPNEIAVVPDFHKRILFSFEAHFWLNGYVNKQNSGIWSEANPQVYVETPLHPEKLTGALYGLVESFFKNDEGHNVTVNGDRYRAMITNFFIPELNSHDVQELWFQQDGATCHTARATIDLLKDTFGDHLISRFGPVN
ncbi:DUF4817 domain-containing protein [Trichonephila clavipes]|nr:DUF4817 domain-containing protein [Trichonephila clavipes]